MTKSRQLPWNNPSLKNNNDLNFSHYLIHPAVCNIQDFKDSSSLKQKHFTLPQHSPPIFHLHHSMKLMNNSDIAQMALKRWCYRRALVSKQANVHSVTKRERERLRAHAQVILPVTVLSCCALNQQTKYISYTLLQYWLLKKASKEQLNPTLLISSCTLNCFKNNLCLFTAMGSFHSICSNFRLGLVL